MRFRIERRIRFSQCDPAGIVFYPRYAEMINDLVEDWLAAEFGLDIGSLHKDRGLGIPAARLEIDYIRPCLLWDPLEVSLEVLRIGRSSVRLAIEGSVAGEVRFRAELVIVFVKMPSGKSTEIPQDFRDGIARFQRHAPS